VKSRPGPSCGPVGIAPSTQGRIDIEYLVGVVIAACVCLLTTAVGMYRERALYSTMAIVIASFYGLFAVMGGPDALLSEIIGIAIFVLLAVIGYRFNLWIVVVAIAGHGMFDGVHHLLIMDPGVPAWWPGFCMTFDVLAGAWLACLLLTGRVLTKAPQSARGIGPFVDAELLRARELLQRGEDMEAFTHLERAHVLGQFSTSQHVRVHWHMLRWAVERRRCAEAAGQFLRIAAASVLTAFRLLPEGNTGGTNQSVFRRQPVPADLAQIIAAARVSPLP
jgi:hypothetical protein